jgi:hypothetical protein
MDIGTLIINLLIHLGMRQEQNFVGKEKQNPTSKV